MKTTDIIIYGLTGAFLILCAASLISGMGPGDALLVSFWDYVKFILAVMPGVFILVGLFKVWIKRETVVKHLGDNAGVKGIMIALGLAFTCVGGLPVALPIARQLYDKGTRLRIVAVFLGASCVCRIPMTLWEASLLGVEFTLIRYAVSLPLIIIQAILLEKRIRTSTIKEAFQ